MKKTKYLNAILLFGVFGFLIFSQNSCVKDYTDFDKISQTVDYTPSVAGAVAHTKLTIRDIIRDYDEDELFTEDQTGFLYLMYDKRIFTETAEEVISIPNQIFPTMDRFDDLVYNAIPDGTDGYRHFPTDTIHHHFIVNNQEQLDSVKFDAMDIHIDVNSSFHVEGILVITFPTLMKNGNPYETTVYPDATGSFHYSFDTHIEDYTLVFDANKVLVEFDLQLKNSTGAASGEKVDISISMNNLDFEGIFGYVGKINMNVPQDTVSISIFENAFDGDVYFEDPSMTLHIDNSFGLPIRTYYDSLYTYSTITGQRDAFPFPGDDSLDINYPTTIGQTVHQEVVLDVNNFPEIRQIISDQPQYLFFDIDAYVNPTGYVDTFPNFVLDTSRVSVNLEVKLPLWGNALYSLVDTVKMDVESNFEDISKHFVEANLRTIFDNFLPTNVYAQVFFTDSLYNIVSILYEGSTLGERLINSAILDGDGRATQAVKKTTDIVFGNGPQYERDINDLEMVKYAIIIATLKTDENGGVGGGIPLVKFYSDNFLEVKFGVKGKGKYEGVIE